MDKYEYLATVPSLPQGATSPVMTSQEMTDWLNVMAADKWHFIGCGIKFWNDMGPQSFWIFKKEVPDKTN